MFGRRKYTPPVGWTWQQIEIDENLVADYRFDRSASARFRVTLDVAAAAYLALAAIPLLTSTSPPPVAVSAWLTRIARVFLLRRFFAHSVVVFAILIAGILLHESRWLK